jgi:hypothetical protein
MSASAGSGHAIITTTTTIIIITAPTTITATRDSTTTGGQADHAAARPCNVGDRIARAMT